MASAELYKGPQWAVVPIKLRPVTTTVGSEYNPIDQAIANGWMTEADISKLMDSEEKDT